MQFIRPHRFLVPASMTYASVVSRDTVRIALTLAALNDCEVLCADVQNAYLNAPPKEKVWIVAGPEFGVHEGKTVVIVRALYGLKGAGAAWATAVRQMMQDMGFRSCLADRDLWMRLACDTTRVPSPNDPTTKLIIERNAKDLALPEGTIVHRDEEGGEVIPKGDWYYEYVLFHTDDCMVISRRASNIIGTGEEPQCHPLDVGPPTPGPPCPPHGQAQVRTTFPTRCSRHPRVPRPTPRTPRLRDAGPSRAPQDGVQYQTRGLQPPPRRASRRMGVHQREY